MIRLIALDLDGTLLDSAFQVSPANLEAVGRAKERGVEVVLSTARWYGIAQRTARRLELRTPLICHNGAHIREPEEGAELLHLQIDVEPAREIVAYCDERGCETMTTINGITYMRTPMEAAIDPARLPKDMRIEHDQAQHVTGPVTGILVFGEDACRPVIERFEPRFGDRLCFPLAASEGQRPYITITHVGADKGRALRLVCERLGVPPDQVLAMGDAHHDIAMFELAGTGVAMGNATAEVQARADAVAPSNDHDGVAWAIERFVLS
jgi:Cof subfamily protein (haloacid dehalogenase superfamily)